MKALAGLCRSCFLLHRPVQVIYSMLCNHALNSARSLHFPMQGNSNQYICTVANSQVTCFCAVSARHSLWHPTLNVLAASHIHACLACSSPQKNAVPCAGLSPIAAQQPRSPVGLPPQLRSLDSGALARILSSSTPIFLSPDALRLGGVTLPPMRPSPTRPFPHYLPPAASGSSQLEENRSGSLDGRSPGPTMRSLAAPGELPPVHRGAGQPAQVWTQRAVRSWFMCRACVVNAACHGQVCRLTPGRHLRGRQLCQAAVCELQSKRICQASFIHCRPG